MRTALTRRLALYLGYPVLGLLLVLAALEGLVRIFQPIHVVMNSPPGLTQPDPPRRHRLTPGYDGVLTNSGAFQIHVRVNSLGMRSPEIEPDKAPGTQRVLVIGDSFAFGYGVEAEESFPGLLGRNLGANGRTVQVLNGGVPAFGLPDELAWLARYGIPLEPDVVLVSIFLANDILDATAQGSQGVVGDAIPQAGGLAGTGLWLYRHTHLYRFANLALPQGWVRSALGLPEPIAVPYLTDVMRTCGGEDWPVVREGTEKNREAIAELAALADEHGFEVAAVLIPARFQLDPELMATFMEFIQYQPQPDYDVEAPARFFREAFEAHGIPTLDLSPVFSEAIWSSEEPVYFNPRVEPHWTAAGHRLATRHIGEFLLEHRPLNGHAAATSE